VDAFPLLWMIVGVIAQVPDCKQGRILPEPEVSIGLAQPLPIDGLQDRARAMTAEA
jgi:hypothetical protein